MTKTSDVLEAERQVKGRRLLELIDEVQERLTLIRRQAENLTEIANKSCNGAKHA